MTRILFCTWQYHPVPAGGAERQARLQAEELVARGHDVAVVCPQFPGATSRMVGGVRVVRLRRLATRVRIVTGISYLLNLFRFVLVNGRRYDVVHVHLANLQADVVVAAARLVGVPSHVKVANSGMYGETRRLARIARVTRWYGLRHADSVQALSGETADELARIGVSADRVARIPNGVLLPDGCRDRTAGRERLGISPDARIVLFAGRFARYKGLADLLEAWQTVRRHGWTLLLVGEEAIDDPLGAIPEFPDVIVHPWAVSIQPYLDAADVFALPSHSEGMSNALLEAMASGVAIVSSDAGAAREMLEDGRSGLVHPQGDVEALAASLDAVMSDESLRSRLAGGALERVQAFTVSSVVDRLERIYATIARRQS